MVVKLKEGPSASDTNTTRFQFAKDDVPRCPEKIMFFFVEYHLVDLHRYGQ